MRTNVLNQGKVVSCTVSLNSEGLQFIKCFHSGSFARSCLVKTTFLCIPYFLLFNSHGLFPSASSTFYDDRFPLCFVSVFPDNSVHLWPLVTQLRVHISSCRIFSVLALFVVVSIHTNCELGISGSIVLFTLSLRLKCKLSIAFFRFFIDG